MRVCWLCSMNSRLADSVEADLKNEHSFFLATALQIHSILNDSSLTIPASKRQSIKSQLARIEQQLYSLSGRPLRSVRTCSNVVVFCMRGQLILHGHFDEARQKAAVRRSPSVLSLLPKTSGPVLPAHQAHWSAHELPQIRPFFGFACFSASCHKYLSLLI